MVAVCAVCATSMLASSAVSAASVMPWLRSFATLIAVGPICASVPLKTPDNWTSQAEPGVA